MNKKLSRKSMDITEETIDQLKKILPAAFTEDKIDFNRLKQLLGEHVDSSPERFGLSWFGKSDAIKTMQQVSKGTLRPVVEKSANFDEAENLIIEGDNLEVLKLLQKAYYNKVKMIYIDPPYNRKDGNDLIYEDNFSEPIKSYLKYTGQLDENGDAVSSNTEKNGRRHSKWLSMLYPRLYLARNLLRDDGVIFVSIDDNEIHNLIQIMNEIFGEENFVSTICVKMSHLSGVKMSHKDKKIPKTKEFIIIYSKNKEKITLNPVYIPGRWKEVFDRYTKYVYKNGTDCEQWQVVNLSQVIKEKGLISEEAIENFCIEHADNIFRTAVNDSLSEIEKEEVFKKVKTKTGLEKYVFNGEEVLFASSKLRVFDGKKLPAETIGDIWTDIGINNLHNEGEVDFPNGKKPIKLVKRLIELATNGDNDYILDFFAGSGTTAHAVMDLNKEDGGNRKYILVQLPESTDHDEFKTIAEITRERVIRSAKQLDVEPSFKYFKLDSSNFTEWNEDVTTVEEINEQLEAMLNPIKEGRTQLDLLYEVLLKGGFPITTPIQKHNCKGKTFYGVERSDGELLLIYLETEIVDGLVEQMLSLNPKQVIFLDECFQNDVEKKNMQYEFEEFHHTKVEFTSI